MEIDILLFGAFGVLFIFLFLIIYFKGLETNRKFERYGRAIDDLNKQNHQLKQILAHKKEEDKIWLDGITLDFHKKVQDEINTKVLPLLDSLREIEGVIATFKNDQQNRIDKLEQHTKSFNLPSNSSSANEKQIIALYNQGRKPYEIAKDLRMGIGEVEFTLKMHNLS